MILSAHYEGTMGRESPYAEKNPRQDRDTGILAGFSSFYGLLCAKGVSLPLLHHQSVALQPAQAARHGLDR